MPAPQTNIEAYILIFEIETVLRELIVEELDRRVGARWPKRRLGPEAYNCYKDARDYERKLPWDRTIPHHPVYYLHFPFLKETLVRKDNWAECFKEIFLREDLLRAALTELEPIRNAIAHNRCISSASLDRVSAIHGDLWSAIGVQRATRLLETRTVAPDIREMLTRLLVDARRNRAAMLSFLSECSLDNWMKASSEWWLDEDYLGAPTLHTKDFFVLCTNYAALPRMRGSGHEIERWVGEHGVACAADRCILELSSLVGAERPI